MIQSATWRPMWPGRMLPTMTVEVFRRGSLGDLMGGDADLGG